MKVWSVFTAKWIWWGAIVGLIAWVCSSSLLVTNNNLSIDKVEFRVMGCNKESYSTFLKLLRKNLSSKTSLYNIPLLPIPSPPKQDLLFVEIFDWEDKSITLVLNRINAYVIAYKVEDHSYLLRDTPNNDEVYGKNQHNFSFDGSYPALEKIGGRRENIDLGINELAQAVSKLRHWYPDMVTTTVASSLIVLIQMVSETARFRAIEQKVINTIMDWQHYKSFRPGVGVMDLQTNWGTLSYAVQDSDMGVFSKPVELKTSATDTVFIRNVEDARKVCGLALLLYKRKGQA